MSRVLVLGAGLVSRPLVRYLLDQPETKVRVATRTVSKAERIIEGHKNGEAIHWLVEDREGLKRMMEDSDIVVSLLPYVYHVMVADLAIERGIPLVTTSYVSKEMMERDKKAREKDVLLLNEIGLDPGIDHMSAKKTIDYVRSKNGNVLSFTSHCGAIPSPEANTNPIGYKFSWSPRGVVLAARNSARYLKDGEIVEVPSENLFDNCSHIDVDGIGHLEVYPNRDSLPYREKYSIEETKTMFRGTIRYPGWCELWRNFKRLGLLDDKEIVLKGFTKRSFFAYLTEGKKIEEKEQDTKKRLSEFLNIPEDSDVIKKMEWLGFFEEEPLSLEKGAALDVLTQILLSKLRYDEGERDMVILYDEVIAEYPDGTREKYLSSLVDFGEPGGDTSVSRTVALPAAIAVKLILEDKITLKGVHIPVHPMIYGPVLKELQNLGMKITEETERL